MSNPLSSVDPNLLSSPPSSATPTSSRPIKLAPIFTRSYSSPRSSPMAPSTSTSIAGPSSSPLTMKTHVITGTSEEDGRARKRVRLDVLTPLHAREENVSVSVFRKRRDVMEEYMDIDENGHSATQEEGVSRGKPNIQDWFVTTPIRGEVYHPDHSKDKDKDKDVFGGKRLVHSKVEEEYGTWRRKCRRGVMSRNLMITTQRPIIQSTLFLETLITRLTYCPESPPSVLYIPSLHPWNQPRDHAPPLAVAFSNSAKIQSAFSAKSTGSRRLVAAAAEEGGVRIVDVDQPLGVHPDSVGWFWRAHGNAVLDLKWSNNDSRILTASGDATTRLHALDGPEPTLIASLIGHEASVKSCTFFDPTRSGVDPSISSTVVATAGRDGSILIYDVRAPGNASASGTASGGGNRRSGRPRYSQGVDGFRPQIGGEIAPVMEIKAAHDPSKKRNPYSISSLLALQSMPGHLASGAAHEGVVKVWDPRFNTRSLPHPTTSLPDPTCSASSRRPRGIHSMVEQLTTGDIHLLTADSKIHVVRPSAYSGGEEAIQPGVYVHPELRSTFWMKISFSPCGRYLASGSSKGGLMTWDTQLPHLQSSMREVTATRISPGGVYDGLGREKEVNAVDWGYDMVAACTEDSGTRIWRADRDVSIKLKGDREMKRDWAGVVE